MAVNWTNPYENACDFKFKGSLHTHTPNPASRCGSVPIGELAGIYKRMGLSFMAVTNHNYLTDLAGESSPGFCVLPGIEIDIATKRHFGVVHADASKIHYDPKASQQELIDRNVSAGALVTLHHPDWQLREHYTIDELLSLNGYDGIEIYNSIVERLDGSPLSTAKWDRLLASGRRVLGFANQDFHELCDASFCCNAAACADNSASSIFAALKAGRFYCHNGVSILKLGRNGDVVRVATANAKLIRFVGPGGVVLKKVKGVSAEFEFLPDSPANFYVRVECLGEGEEISFSQPFFRCAAAEPVESVNSLTLRLASL